MPSLSAQIKEKARALGFELVGIAAAAEADDFAHLQDWLAQGFAGAMDYMTRHAEARRHPASILPAVRSVVMVGLNYHSPLTTHDSPLPGRISCYAGGRDYHDVLREKLKALLAWIDEQMPGVRGRAIVDTAPLLERDFARRAGLGWIGKNTMLIDKKIGSYFFLGALLLNVDLPADEPFDTFHCGTCTRCLDACPTEAFAGPFQLDARRCISYLTIELRGPVPDEFKPMMGDWIFGCDVCQEVCPWNRKAPQGREPAFAENGGQFDLIELLEMNEDQFRARFRHTALWRAGRAGLARNAALALGNSGDERALPTLQRALGDADEGVREAAAWAVRKIGERAGS